MNKIFNYAFVLSVFTLFAFVGTKSHMDVYKVDTGKSTLEWYAEKMSGKHHGTIKISNGELKDDHGKLTGTLEIDMNTIENKDLESPVYKAKLENHLKSEDFFSVVKYPKSTFVLTSITPIADARPGGLTHHVKGMLTIKNKTNEIAFDATIVMQENSMSCVGSAIVDRSKFDVKYGSKTFFADIGDKMIYDDFTLKFN